MRHHWHSFPCHSIPPCTATVTQARLQVPPGQRVSRTETRLPRSSMLPPLHRPQPQRLAILERSRQRVSVKRVKLLPHFSSKSTRRYIALHLWRESVAAFHQARLTLHVIPPARNCNTFIPPQRNCNTFLSRCCSPPPAAAACPCRTSFKCSARRASGRCVRPCILRICHNNATTALNRFIICNATPSELLMARQPAGGSMGRGART